MKKLLTIALLAAAFGITAWAQVATGSLAGTVFDSTGAVVPAVKVTATAVSTGVKIETTSTDAGLYVFASMPPAVYSVTAEKTGFKKLTREGVEIRIAQRLDMNLTMELGDVQQSVTITADVPLLQTSTAERGESISTKLMDNLPLFAGGIRNPRGFVNYMAGVTNSGEQSVSGSGGRAQEVLIDGASALNVESSAVFNFPSAEMFGEFKMLASNYSAEYGRVGGGIEIYVSKSGTNWFHGAAFHNMRRDIWQSNAWARNANPNPAQNFRAKERFNETGGSAGGPVYIPKVYDGRDKTFWFFTITKDLRPVTIGFPVSTVPTALMKTGNFSQAGVATIYDPATTAGTVRDPFPGNVIPQSRFSARSRAFLQYIPDPNVSALAGNFTSFVNQTVYTRDIWSLKGDHAFTPMNRVSYFYNKESEDQNNKTVFEGPLGQGLQNLQKPYNHRFNHDWNIRPNLLMHSTYSFSKTQQTWSNPNQNGFGSKLGFALSGDSDATPRVQFLGAAGLTPWGVQDGKVNNGAQYNRQHWISQGYTLLQGKHEFKFGGAWRRFETLGQDLAGTNGLYVFNRTQTGLPGVTASGHEFASFLLGGVDSASNVVPPVLFDTTIYYDSSVYFQDNWRVHPKLTLNLGLRYEVPIGWHVPGGNGYSHIDINVPNPGAGGRPGALVFSGTGPGRTGVKRFYPTDYSNWGPRLGFAWQVMPKTVIRGGWAIYYQGLSSGGCGCRFGFAGSNSLQSDGRNAVLNWDSGIPVAPGYRPPPIIDPTYMNYQTVSYQGPTAGQAGRIKNFSFSIQHEVKNWLFDIGYQRNRGTRLNSTMDLNQLPTSMLSRGSILQQPLNSAAAQAAGYTAPFAGFRDTLSVAQSLRPFPQYLSVNSLFAGFGKSWYDALQLKVERRFGSFQLMSNYTWSKSLGIGHYRQVFGQGGSPGATPQDYNNVADSKSFMNMDVPHVFNVLAAYDLPFGKGKKYLGTANAGVNALVGGWTVSGIAQYRKGTLIWLTTPGNPLGNGVLFAPATKANWTGGAIRTGVDRQTLDPNNPNIRFFNPGVFTAAPSFTLGTAAFYHDDFRQPAVLDERMSIVKRTTLWQNEKNPVVLIYRADGFNIFNRTSFGNIVGAVGNANFGRPQSPQNGVRIITMGLRLEF